MTEKILFVTGHLARGRLEAVLTGMTPAPFEWTILDIGVKVAALMTEPILMRRLPRPIGAGRVVVPGRCRADLDRLSDAFGARFERGPDELKDLPAYFGKSGGPPDLSRYSVRIFAELVDASRMTVEAIVARAGGLSVAGADVIDLGCLPDTPFPHLEDAVRALKERGLSVSVDFGRPRRTAAGRRGRRGLPAQPDGALPLDRRGHWRAPGCHRREPRRSRLRSAARRRRPKGAGSRPFSIRFSIRSISVSPSRWRDFASSGRACRRPR